MAGFLLSPLPPHRLGERHRPRPCASDDISAMLRSILEDLLSRPHPPAAPLFAAAGAEGAAPAHRLREIRVRACGPTHQAEPDRCGGRRVDPTPNAVRADQASNCCPLVLESAGRIRRAFTLVLHEAARAWFARRCPCRIPGPVRARLPFSTPAKRARRRGRWRDYVAEKRAFGPSLIRVVPEDVADIAVRQKCNAAWTILCRQPAFDPGGAATGARPGDRVIATEARVGKSARGLADTNCAVRPGAPMPGSEMSMSAPDAAVDREGIPRADLVKMDMEGGELNALRGAKATIGRSRQALPSRRVTGAGTSPRFRHGSTPSASGTGCTTTTPASIGSESCCTLRVHDWRRCSRDPAQSAPRGSRCPMRPRRWRGAPRTARPRRTCNNTP